MSRSRRFLLGVLVVGLACGDESAPVLPSAIVIAGGNGQSALPGATLALPLRVTVTGSGGAAFPGARVVWTVTTGSAALGSPTDTTDVNGEASTTVTIGVTPPGNVVVTATVTGVPAVTFGLTALDPCTVAVTVPVDTTATNGVLTIYDCQFDGSYYTDFYRTVLPGQAGLLVSMNATFDTYVEHYHVDGPFMAFNDDTDSTITNSRLNIIAAPGTYVVAASTFAGSVTGSYTIRVAPRAQTITGCRGLLFVPWITRGVALTEQVQATDCTTIRPGGRAYSDRVLISLAPTRPLAVTLASAAFNPRLELYEETQTGEVFRASADGSAGTATLNFTPTGTGGGSIIFRLEITSVDTVQTGDYSLTVTGPAPGEANVTVLPLGLSRPGVKREKARPN